ncbi:MAG: aminoglycoside phosphotransferase family protein [Patescibacteria group bacterium]
MEKRHEITVPTSFAHEVTSEQGDAGQEWLDALPKRFADACNEWGLTIDGDPMHGHLGLVFPVRRGKEKCALKISAVNDSSRHEALALATWNGNGAVKLLDAKPEDGVLLLERLDATRSLEDIDVDDAVTVSGQLLRRLAVPAPAEVPKLADHMATLLPIMTERWEKFGKPFSKDVLDAAQGTAKMLSATSANLLVDFDLHYGNVLAGEREPWLVIDPKVLAGDPEYGLWPLLFCRRGEAEDAASLAQRFDALLEASGLDRDKAKGWALVKTAEYWLWALSIGLTEDPKRCKVMMDWLRG